MTSAEADQLKARIHKLALWGLLDHWDEICEEPWLQPLLAWQEQARDRRSLERRIRQGKLPRFKPMSEFDYDWPKKLDRELLDELFQFHWLEQGHNVVLVGPNGVGKTMIAQNLTYQAILRGATARFLTVSDLLNELTAQEGAMALERRFRHYARPLLICLDEVGYLSYSNRHADLLFEIVNRRYGNNSILITTNKPFAEWNDVFPNASCVVALIDRLVHHSEILQIDGDSYRLKESRDERVRKAQQRSRKRRSGKSTRKTEGS